MNGNNGQEMPRIRLVRTSSGDVLDDDALTAGKVYNTDVDDETVITSLIAHKGVPSRVAVDLNIREEHVIKVITRNANVISQQLRAVMMVGSFTSVVSAGEALQTALATGEMLPGDIGRTFAASLSAFSQLAGQFQKVEEVEENDDADSAKSFILERLGTIGKRERLASDEAQASG